MELMQREKQIDETEERIPKKFHISMWSTDLQQSTKAIQWRKIFFS